MKLTWNKGIKKLMIQSDSKATIGMLSTRRSKNNQHASLIEQFYDLASSRNSMIFCLVTGMCPSTIFTANLTM
ncbi:hypothetical protein LINPERHAP2_LOCUS16775 [Linum perenne]